MNVKHYLPFANDLLTTIVSEPLCFGFVNTWLNMHAARVCYGVLHLLKIISYEYAIGINIILQTVFLTFCISEKKGSYGIKNLFHI